MLRIDPSHYYDMTENLETSYGYLMESLMCYGEVAAKDPSVTVEKITQTVVVDPYGMTAEDLPAAVSPFLSSASMMVDSYVDAFRELRPLKLKEFLCCASVCMVRFPARICYDEDDSTFEVRMMQGLFISQAMCRLAYRAFQTLQPESVRAVMFSDVIRVPMLSFALWKPSVFSIMRNMILHTLASLRACQDAHLWFFQLLNEALEGRFPLGYNIGFEIKDDLLPTRLVFQYTAFFASNMISAPLSKNESFQLSNIIAVLMLKCMKNIPYSRLSDFVSSNILPKLKGVFPNFEKTVVDKITELSSLEKKNNLSTIMNLITIVDDVANLDRDFVLDLCFDVLENFPHSLILKQALMLIRKLSSFSSDAKEKNSWNVFLDLSLAVEDFPLHMIEPLWSRAEIVSDYPPAKQSRWFDLLVCKSLKSKNVRILKFLLEWIANSISTSMSAGIVSCVQTVLLEPNWYKNIPSGTSELSNSLTDFFFRFLKSASVFQVTEFVSRLKESSLQKESLFIQISALEKLSRHSDKLIHVQCLFSVLRGIVSGILAPSNPLFRLQCFDPILSIAFKSYGGHVSHDDALKLFAACADVGTLNMLDRTRKEVLERIVEEYLCDMPWKYFMSPLLPYISCSCMISACHRLVNDLSIGNIEFNVPFLSVLVDQKPEILVRCLNRDAEWANQSFRGLIHHLSNGIDTPNREVLEVFLLLLDSVANDIKTECNKDVGMYARKLETCLLKIPEVLENKKLSLECVDAFLQFCPHLENLPPCVKGSISFEFVLSLCRESARQLGPVDVLRWKIISGFFSLDQWKVNSTQCETIIREIITQMEGMFGESLKFALIVLESIFNRFPNEPWTASMFAKVSENAMVLFEDLYCTSPKLIPNFMRVLMHPTMFLSFQKHVMDRGNIKDNFDRLFMFGRKRHRVLEKLASSASLLWAASPEIAMLYASEIAELCVDFSGDVGMLDDHLYMPELINNLQNQVPLPKYRVLARITILAMLDEMKSESKFNVLIDKIVLELVNRISCFDMNDAACFTGSKSFATLYYSWQSLCFLFQNRDTPNDEVLWHLTWRFLHEGLPPQVRQIVEGYAVNFLTFHSTILETRLLPSIQATAHVKTPFQIHVSLVTVLAFSALSLLKSNRLKSCDLEFVLEQLNLRMINNVGFIRASSQYLFRLLWSEMRSRGIKSINSLVCKMGDILLDGKDFRKVSKTISAIYTSFDPASLMSLKGIMEANMNREFIFSEPIHEKIAAVIAEYLSSIREVVSPLEERIVNIVSQYDVFQKKLSPSETLYDRLFEEETLKVRSLLEENAQKKTNRQSLIVFASLVSKTPNIAGLSRTCEIFQASKLVLSDLKVLKDKHFKTISVSAENWIPFEECSRNDEEGMVSYLTNLKDLGYSLIALEQTSNSHSLETFTFPEKCVIVLGTEKEGIPARILGIMDFCVEIPQLGIIRSLNVHVSASLCIWEYSRQQMLQKRRCQ